MLGRALLLGERRTEAEATAEGAMPEQGRLSHDLWSDNCFIPGEGGER